MNILYLFRRLLITLVSIFVLMPAISAASGEKTINIVKNSHGNKFEWLFTCAGSGCNTGQFMNGDYWLSPVSSSSKITLVSVSPSGIDNGLEANPVSMTKQGFLSCQDFSYDANLNLMTKLPVIVRPNTSLVKSIKRTQHCGTKSIKGCCIESYDVVTVIESPPKDSGKTAFRPGFAGKSKEIYYIDDFNFDLIPQKFLLKRKLRKDYNEIGKRWNMPYVDHYMNFLGDRGRAYAPHSTLPDYGAELGSLYTNDLLSVMSRDNLAHKMPAIKGLLQRGIDLYTSWSNGVYWGSGAGQKLGRKPPIAFFAAMINREKIKITVANMSEDQRADTQEEGQLRLSKKDENGQSTVIWGDEGKFCSENFYWAQLESDKHFDGADISTRGKGDNKRTCADPYRWIDGPAGLPGSSYMSCCSTGVYIGYSVAQNLMPELCKTANSKNMNNYVKRVLTRGIHTLPDPCAPPDPRESPGCKAYKKGSPGCLYYKKTWGPDPARPGMCIRNGTSGTNQRGRFPHLHGKKLEKLYNEPPISRYVRSVSRNKVFNNCLNQD